MMDRTVVIQNLDISWKYAFMATSPACVISYSYSRNLERIKHFLLKRYLQASASC
nr:MAG TPA: hypothetical protein [Bacteriophage sp.]